MASEKWTIEKLDDTNYGTWKFHVKHLLLAKGMWKYVESAESGADAAVALSTIVLAVAPSQLYLITSCETAKDA
jgi:hypothetical protein